MIPAPSSPALTLAPDEFLLLVKDKARFQAHYAGVPLGVTVIEWTSGSLNSDGEKLELSMPGDQEWLKDRYYIRRERVNYDDDYPWPAAADGTGKSLTRIDPTAYGNDVANWTAADPTPGR